MDAGRIRTTFTQKSDISRQQQHTSPTAFTHTLTKITQKNLFPRFYEILFPQWLRVFNQNFTRLLYVCIGVRTFRPMDISPHRRLTHRRFTPCTWGETSMDNLALQQTFHPMGNLPIDVVGQNIHKRFAPRPWGKTSMGESSMG